MGDTAQLRDRARMLQTVAGRIRDEAARLEVAEEVEWSSPTADRWREESAQLVRDLRREAEQLDEAARALVHHADAVEHAQQAAHAAFDWFQSRMVEAGRIIAAGADTVGDAAVAAARSFADAAVAAPAPGSPDWRTWRPPGGGF